MTPAVPVLKYENEYFPFKAPDASVLHYAAITARQKETLFRC